MNFSKDKKYTSSVCGSLLSGIFIFIVIVLFVIIYFPDFIDFEGKDLFAENIEKTGIFGGLTLLGFNIFSLISQLFDSDR